MTIMLIPLISGLVQSAYGIGNFTVYPRDSEPYDLTYGEWTGKWWQWLYGISKDVNPFNDLTGINCAQFQSGDVWFLAGTSGNGAGGSANLTCTIPVGRSILIPIVNSECSFAENGHAQRFFKTQEGLRSCANNRMDQALRTQASVDGIDINITRIESPLFNLTLPSDNILGISANTTQGVADGYYIFLQPLSLGKHEIHIRGLTVSPNEGNDFYVQDVKYNLIIK